MENIKKEQLDLVNKYFIKTPDSPNYLADQISIISGGALIIFALISGGGLAILLGLIGVALLISGFRKYSSKKSEYDLLYKRAEPKASDEQMDKLLRDGKNQVILDAMERLDIDSEDSRSVPLMIDGPAENTLIGPGKDNILRFRHHNILLFFLTDHNVATFHCILDLGCSEILSDKTKEFPYKDITNLETETTHDTFYYLNDKKSNVKGVQRLSLYTSGGNNISVNYTFNKGLNDIDEYKFPPSEAENTIKAIRKRLKEYKDRFSTN